VATTFDGYPMRAAGPGAEALTAALPPPSSVPWCVLLITFLAPMISSFALKFGAARILRRLSAQPSAFCGLGREAKHKTVISMSLGLLLAGVGMDTVSGSFG